MALRTKALESLLIEKGLLSAEAVDERISEYEQDIGPLKGARVVARAWVDPASRRGCSQDGGRPSPSSVSPAAATWSWSRTRRASTTWSSARSAPATPGRCSGCRRPGTRASPTARAPSSSRARCCASSGWSSTRRSRCTSGTAAPRCATWCSRSARPAPRDLTEEELAALVTRDAMIGVAKVGGPVHRLRRVVPG